MRAHVPPHPHAMLHISLLFTCLFQYWTSPLAAEEVAVSAIDGKEYPAYLNGNQGEKAGELCVNPKDGSEMVWVPAGRFQLGTAAAPENVPMRMWGPYLVDYGENDERPVRELGLSGFWIARHEITTNQFDRFVKATGYKTDAERNGSGWQLVSPEMVQVVEGASYRNTWNKLQVSSKAPVVNVSWWDAAAYCKWAGLQLPTETQWEYAARGPKSLKFPWGNKWDIERCVSQDRHPKTILAEPNSIPAGASWCGALHMSGNVAEWCADSYVADAYSKYSEKDPAAITDGEQHVHRGGSWRKDFAGGCRSAMRSAGWGWTAEIGFRPVAGSAISFRVPERQTFRSPPIQPTGWLPSSLSGWSNKKLISEASPLPNGSPMHLAMEFDGGYPWLTLLMPKGGQLSGKVVKLSFYARAPKGEAALNIHLLQINESGHTRDLSQFVRMKLKGERWRRYTAMFQVPALEYRSFGMRLYPFTKGTQFCNWRLDLPGEEPAKELQLSDPEMRELIPDGGFEVMGPGAHQPPGWQLLKGGARIGTGGYRGKRMMELHPNSRVTTPTWKAAHGHAFECSLWVRGRGRFRVEDTDMSKAGTRIVRGASERSGNPLRGWLTLDDRWRKIELQVTPHNRNASGMRLDFVTDETGEAEIDEVSVRSDQKLYPPPADRHNRFTGGFQSPNGAKLQVSLAGKSIAEMKDGIAGPSILVIHAEHAGAPPQIFSGLNFEDGGEVAADSNWLWTATDPGGAVSGLDFDDASWRRVLFKDGEMQPDQPVKGSVWFRRAIIWNGQSFLVPKLTKFTLAKGFSDLIFYSLCPAVPAKVRSYELEIEVPSGCRVLTDKSWGAYHRPSRKVSSRQVRIGGRDIVRYRLEYDPTQVTGFPGAYGGGLARTSLFVVHQDEDIPADSKVVLRRIINGNVVDMPTVLPIDQQPPPDGTRPRNIMIGFWTVPYVFGNPPEPTFPVEMVDSLMKTFTHCGLTHSAWPGGGGRKDAYLENPQYGPRWTATLRKFGVKSMPVFHRWPLTVSAGTEAHKILRKIPKSQAFPRPKDLTKSFGTSAGWMLSEQSKDFWPALRKLYEGLIAYHKKHGMELDGVAWDYEFEINTYAGGGYDPLTLDLFRKHAKIPPDVTLNREVIKKRFAGPYHEFSRWACRRLIHRTKVEVFDKLGLKFHVYFGEGRPFDPDTCHIISSYGVGQNVPGQIPSMKREYEIVQRGIERASHIRFLGILQPEIQAVHRSRPFHYEELRNNIVKRTVATRGGGAYFFTAVRPQCPTMYYGIAAAARFLARYEDYFFDFEPVFSGKQLDEVVTFSEPPADVVLLKKGKKALLLIFGGEPETQPKPVNLKLDFKAGKDKTIQLEPMGLIGLECELGL